MVKHIDSALKLYRARGFNVTDVHADVELECIREHILPVNINTVAADGHAGQRYIRTIKERSRSTVHGFPFKRLPKILVREICKCSVTCLNQLPADNGELDIMSPTTIMTGKPNPDYNKLKLELGTYVQLFAPTTFASNTIRSRTTGSHCPQLNGQCTGRLLFMSLITGRRLSRHQWTMLPMLEAAIDRVETNDSIRGSTMDQTLRQVGRVVTT
jgi:hypothetical protein